MDTLSDQNATDYLGFTAIALTTIAITALSALGYNADHVYILWLLSSLKFDRYNSPFLVAVVATVAIIVGCFFSLNSATGDVSIIVNRVLSLIIIWLAAGFIYSLKKSQLLLCHNEQRQRSIVDNIPTGMVLLTAQRQLLQINPAFCNILGYSREFLSTSDFNTLSHPEDMMVDEQKFLQLTRGDISSYEVEKRFIHSDGSTITCLLTVLEIASPMGEESLYVNHLTDISASKIAEARLSATLAFQHLVLETIPDLVFVKDEELRIVQANDAFLKTYPKEKREHVLGFTTFEEYEPSEAANFIANDLKALETGYHETEEGIQFPGGEFKTLFTKKIRFTDNGKTYVLGVATDITILKGVQNKLEKANEELEMFSYIASHDLKAPLRAIENLSQWIYEDIKDVASENTQRHIKLLQSRVIRLKVMLADILEYSRVGNIQEESTSLNLNELIRSFSEGFDLEGRFTLVIEGELPRICSPRTPLEQIFSNLISNAIKHHDRNEGTVSISCKQIGNFIEFAIADDGPGIAEEFHEKIFVMFQTLKPRDAKDGSGLGMSIVRKLVEWQGGTIRVESEKGRRGTTFLFTWPIDCGLKECSE